MSRQPQQSQVSDINSPLIQVSIWFVNLNPGDFTYWNFSISYQQEDGDNKVLKLRFDVSQYVPEEIVVKTVDNKLLVS